VEVHPNYRSGDYPQALEAVYRDFFGRYIALHPDENLESNNLVIGMDYSDTLNFLPKLANTFVPQAPVGYTDKSGPEVLSLSLTEPQKIPVRVLKVEDNSLDDRMKPHDVPEPGVSPLTFANTLQVAYLEGKVYQGTSMQEGLHNMENALIATAIKNASADRPNLSLKYEDPDGRMKAYLLAYEGKMNLNGVDKPIVFISDFASDRPPTGSGAGLGVGMAGGKLMLEFSNLYKENYLDKGKLVPIFTNARDETSYRLLVRQMESLGRRLGYRFQIQELGTHTMGSSTMHDILIVPQAMP
jgi:hypothetical protein